MEGSEISTCKDDKVFFNSRKYGYAELSEENIDDEEEPQNNSNVKIIKLG